MNDGHQHDDDYSVSPAAMSDEQIDLRERRERINGPAFPCSSPIQYWGISIREVAAIAAMQGMLSNGEEGHRIEIARRAVQMADALLGELSK